MKNAYLLILLILLYSCSTIWEGTESRVKVSMPFNTRIFDEDSVEVKIQHKKDSTFYIELYSNKNHELLLINDSGYKKVFLENHISLFWVFLDAIISLSTMGSPLLTDYFLGSWYRFDDVYVSSDEFVMSNINIDDIETAGIKNLKIRQSKFTKNVIYGDIIDWDYNHSYGLNYEYSIINKFFTDYSLLNLRLGLYGALDRLAATNFGSVILLGQEHKVEIHLGFMLDYYPPNPGSKFLPKKIQNSISFGYRYQPWNGGIVFRVGYIPFININNKSEALLNKSNSTIYISIGGSW